jgi:hypothetical protein
MTLQFKRPATEWQKRMTAWFGESHRRMDSFTTGENRPWMSGSGLRRRSRPIRG